LHPGLVVPAAAVAPAIVAFNLGIALRMEDIKLILAI
jgi:hypothetical protein